MTQTDESPPTKTNQKTNRKEYQKRINRRSDLRKRPLPPLELIPFADQILMQLDQKRFLTNIQIGELFFRGTRTVHGKMRSELQFQRTAGEAIGNLMDHKLIDRIPVFQTHRRTGNIFQTQVNLLTRKGRDHVQDCYDREDDGEVLRPTGDLKRFTHQKIDHELAINDIAIALQRAVWRLGPEYQVVEWFDDDLLERHKHTTRFHDFTPDAWCLVEGPDDRLCPMFIEVDRGTEMVRSKRNSTKDWYTKMVRYGYYIAHRYHEDPFYAELECDTRKMVHPLVLTITTSEERMKNMLAATEEANGRNTYWYTQRERVFGSDSLPPLDVFLEPIWSRLQTRSPLNLMDYLTGGPEPEPQSDPQKNPQTGASNFGTGPTIVVREGDKGEIGFL